jgi:hypothetical protein
MRERLPLDGHTQVAHMGEVRGTKPAGLMHLGEKDFLGRPNLGPPAADVPLQGPQLAIGEAARVAALQVLEDGLGLQPGIDLQQGTDLGPDRGEGIGPGPPGVGLGPFAGKLTLVQVFAGGLLVHVGQQGATGQGRASRLEAEQCADLFVRDHAQASSCKGLALGYGLAGPGKSNCRQGQPVVVVAGLRAIPVVEGTERPSAPVR